jgi:hypothetical protein
MKPLSFDTKEAQKLFEKNQLLDLRGLGNRLIREAAFKNDYAKAELGVICYALHKIETKSHFVRNPKWQKIKQLISSSLLDASTAAREENAKKFMDALKTIIRQITQIDNELGNYAQNIYEKAKIKQASLAYSYGLSIAQSSALTGADPKEVQNYIGFTTMSDEEPETKTIAERVKELKELTGAV